jgi:diguanylate cyclase (GGDEF)-like protein
LNLTILLVSTLFVFSLCLAAFMLYMYAKRKSAPDIGLFVLLFFANLLYMFGYALELVSQNVAMKLLFNHVQYTGIPFIVPLWLMICVRFCYQDFKWTLPKIAPLLLLPVVTLAMNLTYSMNGLLYSSYSAQTWNRLMVVIFTKGPWYYTEVVWKIFLLIIVTGLLIRTYRRAEGIRRRQTLMLILLTVFALLLTASSFFSAQTSAIDFAVLLLSGSTILLFATLFKYSLFDLVPLAYSRLFDGMDYPAMVLADSLMVVKANKAAARLFPQAGDGRRYAPLSSLFASEEELIDRLMETGESLVEVGVDPEKRFFSAKLTRLNLKENVVKKDYGYLLVLSDITSHVNLVRNLRIEASTDPLTGLLNRRSFYEASQSTMENAVATGDTISLIMIDIDHYKNVNDAYGHQIGDLVLKDLSHIISNQTRGNDIVVRYGGEEFVILLPSTAHEAAITASKRICSAVRQHDFVADDSLIHLTISIGVATVQKVASSGVIDHLIYLADSALYEAKRNGRDRICYRIAK